MQIWWVRKEMENVSLIGGFFPLSSPILFCSELFSSDQLLFIFLPCFNFNDISRISFDPDRAGRVVWSIYFGFASQRRLKLWKSSRKGLLVMELAEHLGILKARKFIKWKESYVDDIATRVDINIFFADIINLAYGFKCCICGNVMD